MEEITERALTGAGSMLRNWMLSECRRSSLKSVSTQTFFITPSISLEDSVSRRKISLCDEDCEKESIKSFSSRDSGIPVSRNQSFASNGPRSPQNVLMTQVSLDNHFSEAVKESSHAEFSNAVKGSSIDSFSSNPKENFEIQRKDEEFSKVMKEPSNEKCSSNTKENFEAQISNEQAKLRHSSGFFKAVGWSFTLMPHTRNKKISSTSKDKLRETSLEPTPIPLSLRSKSLIPQNDNFEESIKTKKTFSFSFFSRSKKYSLNKCPPMLTINPPPSDMLDESRQSISPASSRSGMTSMDVKRSRKQQSNAILQSNDSASITSCCSSETNSTFEYYENFPNTEHSSLMRSFSTTEDCKIIDAKEQLGHLSKSTSDLSQAIPPPPPPPPPPFLGPSGVEFRPKSEQFLGLPQGKNSRLSWSGNPTIKEFEEKDKRFYNTLPRPKSKMKTLNWAKIPSAHVSGELNKLCLVS